MEPYDFNRGEFSSGITNSSILYVEHIPLSWSFDVIYEEFFKFGIIREIRNKLGEKNESFNTWIIFANSKDATRAFNEFSPSAADVKCSLVNDLPQISDIYRPSDQTEDSKLNMEIVRSPSPPIWLILTT